MLSDIKRVVGDHDRFFDDEATRSDQRYADVPALHHRALADACSVVNSLDGKCREELITWFCHQQLQPYTMLFIDDATLTDTEKRYSWMLRHLQSYEERYVEIFPASWGVAYQLCLTFCEATHEQLGETAELSGVRSGARGGCDAEVLVRALELAIEAEKRLDIALDRLEEQAREQAAAAGSSHNGGNGGGDGESGSGAVVALAERKRFAEACPISAVFEGAMLVVYIAREVTQAHKLNAHPNHRLMYGYITDCVACECFWNDLQVREFEDLLGQLQKEERWRVDGDDEEDITSPTGERTTFVLESAKQLVIAVKDSMRRCAALSTREAFLDLLRIFRETFTLYASVLNTKLEAQPAARMLAGELNIAGEEAVGQGESGVGEDSLMDEEGEEGGNGNGGALAQDEADDAGSTPSGFTKLDGLTRGYSLGGMTGMSFGVLTRGSSTLKAQIGEKNADRFTTGFTTGITMAMTGGKAAREGALYYSDEAKKAAVKAAAGTGGKTAALVTNLTGPTAEMKAEEFEAARKLEPTVLALACATAEYCSATLLQLAETYRKRIAPALAEQVDVEPEQEVFAGVVNEGIRLLVAHMELRSVPAFDARMLELPWDLPAVPPKEISELSHSAYIGDVAHELADFAATERRLLSTAHFRYLCDKVVTALVARFLRSLYKCTPLSAGGTQQLTSDCDHIERVLLAMHWLRPVDLTPEGGVAASAEEEGEQRRPASSSFGRFVKREMRRPRAVLQLVAVAPGELVEAFVAAMPSGSLVDLQQVMELQGLPKATRQGLLAAMRRLKREQQG